ncbi:hypothetical protein ACFL35_09525 [Candidatus Riflebacteria bacterium]
MDVREYWALGILLASLIVIFSLTYVGFNYLYEKADKTDTFAHQYYQDEITMLDLDEALERGNKLFKKKGTHRRVDGKKLSQSIHSYLKNVFPNEEVNQSLAKKAREDLRNFFKENNLPIHNDFLRVVGLGATMIKDLEKAKDCLRKRNFKKALRFLKKCLQEINDEDLIHKEQVLDGLLACYSGLNDINSYRVTKEQHTEINKKLQNMRAEAIPAARKAMAKQKPFIFSKVKRKFKKYFKKTTKNKKEYNEALKLFRIEAKAHTH